MISNVEERLKAKIADPVQVDELKRQARKYKISWLKQAYNSGFLSKHEWVQAVRAAGFIYARPGRSISAELWALLPTGTWLSLAVLPLKLTGNRLTVVTTDPFANLISVKIQQLTDYEPHFITISDTDWAIMSRPYTALRLENLWNRTPEAFLPDYSPAVEIVNMLLKASIERGCSDIHLEPRIQGLRVRFRLDGDLFEVGSIGENSRAQVISRLKILAGMDIAEKRLPQDGRFSFSNADETIDCRVSSLPLVEGEKLVVRLLDRRRGLRGMGNLDLSPDNYEKLKILLTLSQGLVLLSGATGTGKTTTLYALLSELNTPGVNIITLEDPVEYRLEGINQMQINHRSKLGFAQGLRSVLRQDPDIIMVGEIRDEETARLALQAALTGHLVFSTLHTKRAAGAVVRLRDMGLESFWLAGALTAIVSQRLLRRLCPYCRQAYFLKRNEAVRLGLEEYIGKRFYRSGGCEFCHHTGFQGRIALHEILEMDNELREIMTASDYDEELLESRAAKNGMVALQADFLYKAQQGWLDLNDIKML